MQIVEQSKTVQSDLGGPAKTRQSSTGGPSSSSLLPQVSFFLQLELDYVLPFLPWYRDLPQVGRKSIQCSMLLCAETLCTMAAEVVVKGEAHPG